MLGGDDAGRSAVEQPNRVVHCRRAQVHVPLRCRQVTPLERAVLSKYFGIKDPRPRDLAGIDVSTPVDWATVEQVAEQRRCKRQRRRQRVQWDFGLDRASDRRL
jgi:hypothetical protein